MRKQSEAEVQAEIVTALELAGCTVYHTSTHGVRRGTGVSKGVPDLLVAHHEFKRGMMLGIEVKKPVGWKWSSPEQQRAHASGHTVLATSAYDALTELLAILRVVGTWTSCSRILNIREQLKVAFDDRYREVPDGTGAQL